MVRDSGVLPSEQRPAPGVPGVASAIWIGLFEMAVPSLLWLTALGRTRRAARLGQILLLVPFGSLVWVQLVLGEEIRLTSWVGLAVFVVGLAVTRTTQRPDELTSSSSVRDGAYEPATDCGST